MAQTGYTFIGLGLVTENKPASTWVIKVAPHEQTPMMFGDLTTQNKEIRVEGTDAAGKPYVTKANTDNSHDARWLPDDSSRLTAPCVRRGELVRIYRYGSGKTYYWKEQGNGRVKRRGEHVVYGASGMLDNKAGGAVDEDGTPIAENHYRAEFAGDQGFIKITTSNVNGESSIWQLYFNGKEGRMTLGSTAGQEVTIDEKEDRVIMKNAATSTVVLDKKKILMRAENSIGLQGLELMAFQSKVISMDCERLIFNASESITSKAPKWNHEGMWSFKGEGTAEGNFKLIGGFKATEEIFSGDIGLQKHHHTAQGERADTTSSKP